MAAGELIALVQFQKCSGGTVNQTGLGGFGANTSADHRGELWSVGLDHLTDQGFYFFLLGACSDNRYGICDDSFRPGE